jgi:hypothetical protein
LSFLGLRLSGYKKKINCAVNCSYSKSLPTLFVDKFKFDFFLGLTIYIQLKLEIKYIEDTSYSAVML